MKKFFLSFVLAFFICFSFSFSVSAVSSGSMPDNFSSAVQQFGNDIIYFRYYDYDYVYPANKLNVWKNGDYIYISSADFSTNQHLKYVAVYSNNNFNASSINFNSFGSFFPSGISPGDDCFFIKYDLINNSFQTFYLNSYSSFNYFSVSGIENSFSSNDTFLTYYFFPDSLFELNPDIPFQDLGFYSKTLGINKAGFLEWLISTSNKDKIFDILPNVAENKLNDIINYFNLYGGSSWSFFSNLPKLLISLSVSDISIDLIKELYQTLLNLYAEYQEYLNIRPTDIVKTIQNLLPSVDDLTNNPLDTDLTVVSSSDDNYVKILKNILNGEIFLMNIINSNTDRIVNSIDKLTFNNTVNVDFDNLTRVGNLSDNYYYGEINNNFSEKMSFYQDYELVSNDFENNFFGDFQQSENLVFNFSLPSGYYDGWEYTQYSINVTEHFRTVIVFVRTFISFFTVLFFYQRIKFNLPNFINRKS